MLKVIENRKLRKLRENPRQFIRDSRVRRVLLNHTSKYDYRKKIRQRFSLIVILPLFIASLYYVFWATDRYASHSQLIIKSVSSSDNLNFGGLGILRGPATLSADAMLVREFIQSATMLERLDQKINLLAHYKSKKADFWSRLSEEAAREEAMEFYRNHIDVSFHDESGILSLEAQAFEPQYAQKILQIIGQESESFLNEINKSLAREQMGFIQTELSRAQQKLKDAKAELLAFQRINGLAQPSEQGKAVISVVNELIAEKTKLETELKTLLGYMNPNAPQVLGLRNRIDAINAQLKGENSDLIDGEDSLSQITARYHELLLEHKFAEDSYKTALVSLEKTRIDSAEKKKFLVTVSKPAKPELALYPKKIKNLLTIFFGLLIVYGISVLTVEIIRENRA